MHRARAREERRTARTSLPARCAAPRRRTRWARGPRDRRESNAQQGTVLARHRGVRVRDVGPRAAGDHDAGGQRARRTRSPLPQGDLAARQHRRHRDRLHRGLAVVRRRRGPRPRLGVLAVPRVSARRPVGRHPERGPDARRAGDHVLGRRVLGRALPWPPLVREPAVLGHPVAAATAAARVATATVAAAERASTAGAPSVGPAAFQPAARHAAALRITAFGSQPARQRTVATGWRWGPSAPGVMSGVHRRPRRSARVARRPLEPRACGRQRHSA